MHMEINVESQCSGLLIGHVVVDLVRVIMWVDYENTCLQQHHYIFKSLTLYIEHYCFIFSFCMYSIDAQTSVVCRYVSSRWFTPVL